MPRLSRDYGSILLGSAHESTRKQRARIQILLTVAIVCVNVIGILIVVALGAVGIPQPDFLRSDLALINFVAIPVYAVVARYPPHLSPALVLRCQGSRGAWEVPARAGLLMYEPYVEAGGGTVFAARSLSGLYPDPMT